MINTSHQFTTPSTATTNKKHLLPILLILSACVGICVYCKVSLIKNHYNPLMLPTLEGIDQMTEAEAQRFANKANLSMIYKVNKTVDVESFNVISDSQPYTAKERLKFELNKSQYQSYGGSFKDNQEPLEGVIYRKKNK